MENQGTEAKRGGLGYQIEGLRELGSYDVGFEMRSIDGEGTRSMHCSIGTTVATDALGDSLNSDWRQSMQISLALNLWAGRTETLISGYFCWCLIFSEHSGNI